MRAIADHELAVDREHSLVRVHPDVARERQARDVRRAAVGVELDPTGHGWQLAGRRKIDRDRDASACELVAKLQRAASIGVPRGRVEDLIGDRERARPQLPLVDDLHAAIAVVDLHLDQRHQLRIEQRDADEQTRPGELDRLPFLEPQPAQHPRQVQEARIDQVGLADRTRKSPEMLATIVDEPSGCGFEHAQRYHERAGTRDARPVVGGVMKRFVLSAVLFAAFAGAMGSSGSVSARPIVVAPGLVTIGPGVQVLPDTDIPVFYSNNYYWRFYRNHWWRSPYYDRGWVYGAPPRAVLGIGRPDRYAHYRPQGGRGRGYARRDVRDRR